MNKNYKAILFHPEGDSVTDFKNNNSIQEVWDKINDMGSKWIFYPICFVATDKTVVSCPEGLEFLKNKRIETVRKYFKATWNIDKDKICNALNNGDYFVYDCFFDFETVKNEFLKISVKKINVL